jgi:hypothetical protein
MKPYTPPATFAITEPRLVHISTMETRIAYFVAFFHFWASDGRMEVVGSALGLS